MRIMTNEGIETLAREYLGGLPLNQRLDFAYGPDKHYFLFRPDLKKRIVVAGDMGDYNWDTFRGGIRKINFLGPIEDIPDYFVAGSEKERKRINKVQPEDKDKLHPREYKQLQLVTIGDDIILQSFDTWRGNRGMRQKITEGIHLVGTSSMYHDLLKTISYKFLEEVQRDISSFESFKVVCNSSGSKSLVTKIFDEESKRQEECRK